MARKAPIDGESCSAFLNTPNGEVEGGAGQPEDVKRPNGIDVIRPLASEYPRHDGGAQAIGGVLDHVSNLADLET